MLQKQLGPRNQNNIGLPYGINCGVAEIVSADDGPETGELKGEGWTVGDGAT